MIHVEYRVRVPPDKISEFVDGLPDWADVTGVDTTVAELGGIDPALFIPDDDSNADAKAAALGQEIWPLVALRIAGHAPVVQSAVLADLVARWIGGFHVPGGTPDDDAAICAEMFASHVELVREKSGVAPA